jgi:predicted transcriptional regulator
VSGRKTIEVRKSAPKEVPFKAYIYCTKTKNKWNLSDYEGAYQNSVGEIVYAQQHVIGEFICNKVDEYKYDYGCGYYPGDGVDIDDDTILETAIDREDINIYAKGKTLYGWHISDLKIYDKPKKLSEFKTPPCEKPEKACDKCKYRVVINTPDMYEVDCFVANGREISRPPQSYMFVEEI